MADTTFTEGIQDSLVAWDQSLDWENYNDAIGSMFEDYWSIVVDQGNPEGTDYAPGWSRLLDPDTCPDQYLPYLAQFVGTYIPPGSDAPKARMIIKDESSWQRGTVAAMISAAQRTLSGTKHVNLIERQGPTGPNQAYWVTISMRSSEVVDLSTVIEAVETVKPAGIQINYVATSGYTWGEAIHIWSDDTQSWSLCDTVQP